MRKILVFMVALALILAACGGEEQTQSVNQEAGEGEQANQGTQETNGENAAIPQSYKIGAIYSKTGPNSPLGEPEWNATELLVEKINAEGGINGVPLEVILADDETTQEKAVQEMNRLIHDEEVLVVLGSSGSGESLAMKGIAMENEVPLISAGASVHIIEPVESAYWVFKTPQNDRHAAERIFQYLSKQGLTKVGLLHDSNAYGVSGREQLEMAAPDFGIEIVAIEQYNTNDPDMKSQLTRINSAGAEVLIVWGTNPGPAVIARNLKELGYDMLYVSSHGSANKTFIDLAQDAAEGVVMPVGRILLPHQLPDSDPQKQLLVEFYEAYVDKFGVAPPNHASYGYDNLMLVVEALKNGATTRPEIRDYLENNIKNWVGASGVFNFSPSDHNGLTSDSLVMAKIENGEFHLLE